MFERRLKIAVFGSSKISKNQVDYQVALRLGRLLAQAGFDVVTGGYQGAMEAISRGAKEAGAKTIGLSVDVFDGQVINPWVDQELRSRTLFERLEQFIDLCSGFVAVRGGIGTLTEVMTVWTLMQVKAVRQAPFILLGECWHAVLDALAGNLYITGEEMASLSVASTPEEAVAELKMRLLKIV